MAFAFEAPRSEIFKPVINVRPILRDAGLQDGPGRRVICADPISKLLLAAELRNPDDGSPGETHILSLEFCPNPNEEPLPVCFLTTSRVGNTTVSGAVHLCACDWFYVSLDFDSNGVRTDFDIHRDLPAELPVHSFADISDAPERINISRLFTEMTSQAWVQNNQLKVPMIG